jgi:glycine betaine transporter
MLKNFPVVFLISASAMVGFVLWGVISPASLSSSMQAGLSATIAHFGWFYLMSMFGFLVFTLYLAVGRFGEIRLGGEEAEPEFSRISWFSMLFAAGMGIGLVFWGAAEPISHFASPPHGIQAESPEAARAALRHTFFHWGLHPWAAYCVVALALGFMQFNRGRPMLISSAFRLLLGRQTEGAIGKTIDILALIATVFGVATSLGLGALQIGSGLHKLFGLENNAAMHFTIIVLAAAAYLASAMTGITRGIRILSNTNLVMAGLLMAAVFLLGPTAFILDALTTTLGDYINSLVSMSMRMTPFSRGEWVASWTLFYWAWWVAWAPFVGMFIARISKGRTIREFVVGVLILPSLASFVWFAIFGGTAVFQAMFSNVPLIEANSADVSMTLFTVLEHLPAGAFTSFVAILLVIIFFVTSADSATFVLGIMSSEGDPDPGKKVKFAWGTLIALIAGVLLVSGGLRGLQTMSILTALPFMALMGVMCGCLYRELDLEADDQRHKRLEKEKLLEKLLRERGRG